jgi:hypothetical protein
MMRLLKKLDIEVLSSILYIKALPKLLKPLPARFMAACPRHGSHKPTLK